MIINNPGHMTKMAAKPIFGKSTSKIIFSGTDEQTSGKRKHGSPMRLNGENG